MKRHQGSSSVCRLGGLPSILLMLICVGCTSVKTTAINRTDSDIFIGNSNGKPKAHCAARPFDGVPITLRVPTHVDVYVKEDIRLVAGDRKLVPYRDKRHLSVETNVVRTDKVFMVDPKRPAAGRMNHRMYFGENAGNVDNTQYFLALETYADDRTVQDITGALKDITNSLENKPPEDKDPVPEEMPDPNEFVPSEQSRSEDDASPEDPDEGTDEQEFITFRESRIVAWKRFDIDSPVLERDIAEFVNLHLNSCNSCDANHAVHSNQDIGMIAEPLPNIAPSATTPK